MDLPESSTRVIAIDWSGAVSGAQKKIWIAEVIGGRLVRLENGRGRSEVAEHLIVEGRSTPRMVVGLDFAFSLPEWFLDAQGLRTARDLWRAAASKGEMWLAKCEPPFWGRPGHRRPDLQGRPHFRRTECEVSPVSGIRPKSAFQIGGAGAVGTGSLRGMSLLNSLSNAGFTIWPFEPPGWPRVVEIYPRLLTHAVNKSSASARSAYLSACFPNLDPVLHAQAAGSDDAFDAAVSALVMAEHLTELCRLAISEEKAWTREGRIWAPEERPE